MSREIAFVHVPKTGGVSLLGCCRECGVRVLDHNLRTPYHISLATFKQHNPQYYSFAFVRNPWDRVVSSFFYLKSGGDRDDDQRDADKYLPYDSFREFVLGAFAAEDIFNQIHFRPQYQWISNEQGIAVDVIGRFESLEQDFQQIFHNLRLPVYRLHHSNRSKHDVFTSYYDEETWAVIGKAYQTDIELFNYAADFSGEGLE